MSKAVMISIHPKWCELIANGKKTFEVRKTKPKLQPPFKVYIYCTQHGKQFFHGGIGEKQCLFKNPDTRKIKFDYAFELMVCEKEYTEDNILSGKVIGEFVCDKITPLFNVATTSWNLLAGSTHENAKDIVKMACLTEEEMHSYAKGKNCFAWHISTLVIYDKPKELSEFRRPCKTDHDCCVCDRYDYMGHKCFDEITRPPQSWCYVEER